MNFQNIRALAMLSICAIMALVGVYMIVVGITHLAEDGTDEHAELAIVGLGHIQGNQHLIIVGIGTLILGVAAKLLWKIDLVNMVRRGKDKLVHSATETGRRVAKMMREKDLR